MATGDKLVKLDGLKAVYDSAKAMAATTEASSSASAAYTAGSYFIYGGILYIVTEDIASGGTITPGKNCVAIPKGLGGEVYNVNGSLNNNLDIIRDALGETGYEEIDLSTGATLATGGIQGTVGTAITITDSTSYRYFVIANANDKLYQITTLCSTSTNYPFYVIGTDGNNVVTQLLMPSAYDSANITDIVSTNHETTKLYILVRASNDTIAYSNVAVKLCKYDAVVTQKGADKKENVLYPADSYNLLDYDALIAGTFRNVSANLIGGRNLKIKNITSDLAYLQLKINTRNINSLCVYSSEVVGTGDGTIRVSATESYAQFIETSANGKLIADVSSYDDVYVNCVQSCRSCSGRILC